MEFSAPKIGGNASIGFPFEHFFPRFVFVVLTIAFLSGFLPNAHSSDYIIICSGQSNMNGAAPLQQMPNGLRSIPANVLYFESGAIDPKTGKVDPMKTFDWTTGGWGNLTRSTYGPIPRFAHTIAGGHPNDRFILLLEAVGGSALCQWVPDYEPKELVDKVQLQRGQYYEENAPKIAALLKAYPKAKPLAFLWLQGESDQGAMAGVYLDNLKRLVAAMRRDTGNPELVAIVGEPCQADDKVFEAIDKFVQEDKNAVLVRTRDISGGGHKTLHFYPGGPVDAVGRRFATAFESRFPADDLNMSSFSH